jgi:hypothetical protein
MFAKIYIAKTYFKTSGSPDSGFFVANRARNPQHGQISVITAHFKPAESSTCFKTIKKCIIYKQIKGVVIIYGEGGLVNGENKD